MINLIPPAHKESVAFARRNSRLIGVMAGILVAVLGAAIITGGSLFYLKQDVAGVNQSIAQSKENLKNQEESATLERAKELNDNLNLAVDVLSNEVLFSELLREIGEIMPTGTVLEGISLTNQVFGLGIDLEIGARDYETGSRAYVNINDNSNKIFEKADLVNITCDNTVRGSDYPCYASIRALFAKDNPFMLAGENRQ